MDTLVDTSVILDLFEDDSVGGDWSAEQLQRCDESGRPVTNAVVYSEVSVGFSRIEELEEAVRLADLNLHPIPREALFLAGKAYLAYRRRQGWRSQLPDFFIGAHAATERMPLPTRDPQRIANYFPTVKIIAPDGKQLAECDSCTIRPNP